MSRPGQRANRPEGRQHTCYELNRHAVDPPRAGHPRRPCRNGRWGGIEHVALHRGDSRPQPHLQRMPAIGQWRRARPKQPPDRIGLCGPEGLPVHVDKACHISRRIRMPVASARSGYRRVARADRFSRHNKTGVADGCTGKESGHRHRGQLKPPSVDVRTYCQLVC